VSAEDARLTAISLVEADLRGVTSHGTRAAPRYLRRILGGGTNPRPTIRVLREGPAFVQLDGDNGLGQVVAPAAMQRAIACARQTGIGLVGVRNSNHFGAAAFWAMQALAEGMIGFATTNGSGVNMVAYNGAEAVVGNSPLAFAVPAGSEPPIVLDMACGVAAAGKIGVAAMKGEPIPLGWGLTADGQPTTDPNAATLVVPLGPKGYGLAVIMDVLAGPLQGTVASCHKTGGQGGSAPGNTGHSFLAIDVAALTDPDVFRAEIDAQIRTIRASRPQPGVDRVYLPGEIEWRTKLERLERGIPLHPAHWEALLAIGREMGVGG
jgi:LDH2 family malate/lactate/ureidoglycolate dehydrogenase